MNHHTPNVNTYSYSANTLTDGNCKSEMSLSDWHQTSTYIGWQVSIHTHACTQRHTHTHTFNKKILSSAELKKRLFSSTITHNTMHFLLFSFSRYHWRSHSVSPWQLPPPFTCAEFHCQPDRNHTNFFLFMSLAYMQVCLTVSQHVHTIIKIIQTKYIKNEKGQGVIIHILHWSGRK